MRAALIAAIVLAYAMAAPAAAESPDALYKKECGACHADFAPTFLPLKTWSIILSTLPNHFGEDASLAPDVVKAIGGYLAAHSHRSNAAGPAPLRITELPWFRTVHDDFMKKSRKVKTWAACPDCHWNSMSSSYGD